MKKILVLILILIPLNIKAAEYDVTSANMKVAFPDDWYVFTRENVEDNKNLENIKVTSEYMNKFFNANSAYIDAIKSNLEFVLRTTGGVDYASLSDYPDEKVAEIASDMGAINNTKDAKVYTNNYKYVNMNYKLDDYYINNYSTVINSTWYNFTVQKKTEFTAEEVTEIRKIIDSISYTIVEETPSETTGESKEEKKENSRVVGIVKLIMSYVIIVLIAFIIAKAFIFKKDEEKSDM